MGLLGNEVWAGIIQDLPQGSPKEREIKIPRSEAFLLRERDGGPEAPLCQHLSHGL